MNSLQNNSVLAIDFGTKRIGLARSFVTLAEPWHIINQADFEDSQEICQHLAGLIEKEGFSQVVVGVSEGEMAAKTEAFIDQLKKYIDIPIHSVDETLSSQVVEGKLKSAGTTSPRRKNIDHFAAAEFLQEWLDQQ